MIIINLDCVNLKVDWISLNFNYLINTKEIVLFFRKSGFDVTIRMNNDSIKECFPLKNKYKMYIREFNKYKQCSTQLIFSGPNAAHLYSLLKDGSLDLKCLKIKGLYLSRLDICHTRNNELTDTNEGFDLFLLQCRKEILQNTTTKNIKLEDDATRGKILKVNKRSNSQYYRIYQTETTTRFELELKSRNVLHIGQLLFKNDLQEFEIQLVSRFFKYSTKVLNLNYTYTEWLVDFYRKYKRTKENHNMTLLTSLNYFKTSKLNNETERPLFHLITVLSFIEHLKLHKACKKHKVNTQIYYSFKFKLSHFTEFTGVKCKNQVDRDNLLKYFKNLQELEPLISEFADGGFQSCVCFPFISLKNDSKNSWKIEMLVPERLLKTTYPFQFPSCFLCAQNKNDRKLKIWLMKSLSTQSAFKILDFNEDFLKEINVRNDQLIKIKSKLIYLLSVLVVNKIISNKITIKYKKNHCETVFITDLCHKQITGKIASINLVEIIPEY